jgi:transcriptional regulator with XRE-family HTH domain
LACVERACRICGVAWIILADVGNHAETTASQGSRSQLQTTVEDPSDAAATVQAARRAAGQRLKAVREAARLTQVQLGRRIGYARSTIWKAEAHGSGAAMLWTRADQELAANGELTRLHAAAENAAEEVRRRVIEEERQLMARQAGATRQPAVPRAVSEASVTLLCPRCDSPLEVPVELMTF